jgi:hypothetical protein
MNPDQQPKQQTPPVPPTTGATLNPYGFIMDTPHKSRKSMLKPNNSSTKSRVLFALGGLTILIIAASIFVSVISGSKQGSTQDLTKLAAEQQEIIRIADLGIKSGVDPGVVAYAQTTKSTVQSQQTKVTAYLVKNKIKLTPLLLNSQKNTKTDAALVAASAANRFDVLFKDTITAELTNYASNLKTNYETAKAKTTKDMLANSYANTALLLK